MLPILRSGVNLLDTMASSPEAEQRQDKRAREDEKYDTTHLAESQDKRTEERYDVTKNYIHVYIYIYIYNFLNKGKKVASECPETVNLQDGPFSELHKAASVVYAPN